MDNKNDTSTAAVERLACQCQSAERALAALNEFPSGQGVFIDAAATLRALAAEREAAEATIADLGQRHAQLQRDSSQLFAQTEAAEAEVARLRAVYDAAHAWWVDRIPKDPAEIALCHALNNTAQELLDALAAIKKDDA